MSIGQRIRALRKLRGLTQVGLAKLVGLDQSTISDIERGANFGADVLQSLCEALETTSTYIMRGGRESDLYEAELLSLCRLLSEEELASAMRIIRALADPARPDDRRQKFKTTR